MVSFIGVPFQLECDLRRLSSYSNPPHVCEACGFGRSFMVLHSHVWVMLSRQESIDPVLSFTGGDSAFSESMGLRSTVHSFFGLETTCEE